MYALSGEMSYHQQRKNPSRVGYLNTQPHHLTPTPLPLAQTQRELVIIGRAVSSTRVFQLPGQFWCVTMAAILPPGANLLCPQLRFTGSGQPLNVTTTQLLDSNWRQ